MSNILYFSLVSDWVIVIVSTPGLKILGLIEIDKFCHSWDHRLANFFLNEEPS